MKAYFAQNEGKNSFLELRDIPIPQCREGEILIKIKTAGVNRLDIIQRKGHYPPPAGASDILGVEACGEVAETFQGGRFQKGQRVMALLPAGGYAEYVAVHESNVLPVPEVLTDYEAGAFPETFFTVWSNVFDRGGLQKGETFLVHGGSSGIGTTAIQLAKAFGAQVYTTVGSDAKQRACKALGADYVINYRNEDFVERIKEYTKGQGVHLILDMVGGDYVVRNYACAAIEGRVVQIAFMIGNKPQTDLGLLATKRLTHTGSTLRARSVVDKAMIAEKLEEYVLPLVQENKIKPLIDQVFPFSQAMLAHKRMEEGDHIGKIVLDLSK